MTGGGGGWIFFLVVELRLVVVFVALAFLFLARLIGEGDTMVADDDIVLETVVVALTSTSTFRFLLAVEEAREAVVMLEEDGEAPLPVLSLSSSAVPRVLLVVVEARIETEDTLLNATTCIARLRRVETGMPTVRQRDIIGTVVGQAAPPRSQIFVPRASTAKVILTVNDEACE